MLGETSLTPSLNELISRVTEDGESRLTSEIGVEAIALDPVRTTDEPFLYQTFASTRAAEMSLTGWSPEQQETFLHMQYEAQRNSYRIQLPGAEYWVIRFDKSAVGRLIIDQSPDEIHVVDIALLPEFRKRGIGSTVMDAIMKEASLGGKAVRLHVERFNPALRWYERLGFRVVNDGPIYLEMVWRSNSRAEQDMGVACVDLSD